MMADIRFILPLAVANRQASRAPPIAVMNQSMVLRLTPVKCLFKYIHNNFLELFGSASTAAGCDDFHA